MKSKKFQLGVIGLISLSLLFSSCTSDDDVVNDIANDIASDPMTDEVAIQITEEPTEGNNLSFPVIWSDGYEKTLREPPVEGEAYLEGEWWYVWGDDPAEPTDEIFSCRPNSLDSTYCTDGSLPGDGLSDIYKAYVQKVPSNVWQAENFSATEPLYVDLVDWGDNLESVNWSIRSRVRTEVILYENLSVPSLEYAMRHVSGWGSDEVHGLQATLQNEPVLGPGVQATVYSHNARLTIQKLNVDRDSIEAGSLEWVPAQGWKASDPAADLINEPILNLAVYEAEDGPGYYNAEINVKGKVIYGYTWNLRHLNDGTGDYRITFSFDEQGGIVDLNTYFDELTEILLPIEEEVEEEHEDSRGGTAVVDPTNNLSYIDIRITQSQGGGGGGGGNGGGGGGGHNGGGHDGGGGGHDGGGGGHDDGGEHDDGGH